VSATGVALKVALCGGDGRMGLALQAIIGREASRFELAGLVRWNENAYDVMAADVVIDFSSASSTTPLLASCLAAGKPLVLGTTGQDASQRAAIAAAAIDIGVVFAANFSVGVNALFWLTREAARILGPGFDLEVVEMHHRLKKDAPSGTARRLAEILAEVRGLDPARDSVHGRHGLAGERGRQEIGLHAIRGGDVVGEHTVLFAETGERLELTHRASNRETFAAGALRAAEWLVGQPAGLYDMEDVLGLRTPGSG
jgi:4-hydroxy-tetrahydrodipicolinate reductase